MSGGNQIPTSNAPIWQEYQGQGERVSQQQGSKHQTDLLPCFQGDQEDCD